MAFDYSSSFAGLNSAINSFGKTLEDRRQRQSLADLGKQAIGGDYNAAAAAAFASGDAGTGLGLLKLGQVAREQADGRKLLQSWGIGGGGDGAALPAPSAGSAPATPVSGTGDLIQNESGGNWAAQNNAVGSGGARGHFGRAQFGQARLQEAANAGAIPQGTTPQQFMRSPELQVAAEKWHFGDIDNKISANGFDRLIGQSINGVPITIAGLRNVAHLGGTQGMKRFIETGGRYNPSDANGTSLMDYLQMGARSSGVRSASADAPAPGATYASAETGARGFAIPQGGQPVAPIAIDPNSSDAGSRTFLQSQAQTPLAALGAALAPQAVPQNAPLPPRRPADLVSAQPAQATAPASAPVQSVAGDDPAKLRADADYYERTNPEAARQLRARADALETGATGGGLPAAATAAPQAGMTGRTFDATYAANQPLDPAFKSEGVSQPWMGSALAPQREAPPQIAAPLDPRADQTPGTGSPTQGFVVPQGQAAASSIAEDKDVRLWQDRYSAAAATNNERAMTIAKQRLEMAVKAAERRMEVEKPTDVQRNYAMAQRDPAFREFLKEQRAQTTIKNEGQIPPGYRAVRDANGNLERVEPIPGSKAAQEAEVAAEKKVKADRIKGEVGTTVGNALDDIDRLMASATLPTSGAMGARVANIPGTAAYDISQALTTIGANISFAQLQQMREASPTGGALGAVSDNEQKLLQNSYAALSQSQSPEQFKTNLGRVRATFERIVHGRTLTAQERKTGGPMTVERAKGIRDDAAAAIAGGAPRDAVLKRLKEDYGISTDGL